MFVCVVLFLIMFCDFVFDVVYFVLLFVFGWQGLCVVDYFGILMVVIYQIDILGYVECYGMFVVQLVLV